MINKMISSAAIGVTGAGGTGSLYIDKNDDNYGLGESIAFHADAEDNIALGALALISTSGAALRNIAIGTEAGEQITTGDDNIFIGYRVADGLAANISNTVIGSSSLGHSSAQVNSVTALGYGTLKGDLSTAADGTVAIGHSALTALTTGANNTAIGYQAMLEESTGGNNTVIGYTAMKDSLAGLGNSNNTFIGYASGSGTWLTASSNDNTAVGSYTLTGPMNGAQYNTAIGYF
jgi:hypothetical protein